MQKIKKIIVLVIVIITLQIMFSGCSKPAQKGIFMFGINVMDFGAKGDGKTDDTVAIQKAINYAAKRGGGKIYFPFTKNGYRIASPGIEKLN